mmetsp:Transcript_17820/g.55856  ORF Transcript_17820/g.55856 Transcript_17820/m.55856 type:complete len:162 (-) Transcript_17820:54-539(-)
MRSLLLFLAYVTGLVVLVATKHRDSLRLGLIRLGLLSLETASEDEGGFCQTHIPFARDMKLFAGEGLRGCNGSCDETCDVYTLFMHTNGKLALYHGNDASVQVVWQVSSRPWWRKAAVSDLYWAEIRDEHLRIGRGNLLVWKRKLARCKQLLAHLTPLGAG